MESNKNTHGPELCYYCNVYTYIQLAYPFSYTGSINRSHCVHFAKFDLSRTSEKRQSIQMYNPYKLLSLLYLQLILLLFITSNYQKYSKFTDITF